jgi:hypothetical protein
MTYEVFSKIENFGPFTAREEAADWKLSSSPGFAIYVLCYWGERVCSKVTWGQADSINK